MRAYVDQALIRLGYLHSGVSFSATEGWIVAQGDTGRLPPQREILHQLYREKIYQESLPMRHLMYKALLA